MKTIKEKEEYYKISRNLLLWELKKLTKFIENDNANQKTLDNISKSLENNIHDSYYNYIWSE